MGLICGADIVRGLDAGALRYITAVKVSHNALADLEGLDSLKSLRYLDIRKNSLPSFDSVAPVLRHCDKLRVLKIHNCGKWAQNIDRAASIVFKELAAIEGASHANSTVVMGSSISKIVFVG